MNDLKWKEFTYKCKAYEPHTGRVVGEILVNPSDYSAVVMYENERVGEYIDVISAKACIASKYKVDMLEPPK